MKNIFVGNLNFGATEAAVRSLFEAYGAVERVNIITDRDTGQPRGFGFVEMSANSEADRAIAELNGQRTGRPSVECQRSASQDRTQLWRRGWWADVGVVKSAGSRKQIKKTEGLRDCAASLRFRSRTTRRAAM